MRISEPADVRPLRLVEVPRVVQLGEAALVDDPLEHYCRDTPDSERGRYASRWRLDFAAGTATLVHKGLAWTVGDVDGIVGCHTPDFVGDDIDKYLDSLLPHMNKVTRSMLSPVQQRRVDSFAAKHRDVAKETFGERIKEMVYLGSLATDPPKQGRGYGTALVTQITSLADAQGRATWLASSNIANTGFYNYCGFITKGEVVLGLDDPTWDEPSVVINLMVRECPVPRT